MFAAQQHGSVFWRTGTAKTLKNLDPEQDLHQQLQVCVLDHVCVWVSGAFIVCVCVCGQDCFSVLNSPVWMDSSSSQQCNELQAAVGGAQRVAEITGSRAYEVWLCVCYSYFVWFVNADDNGGRVLDVLLCVCSVSRQTRWLSCGRRHHRSIRTQRLDTCCLLSRSFDMTDCSCFGTFVRLQRISLVSSFAASLFLGEYAAIDYSDGTVRKWVCFPTNCHLSAGEMWSFTWEYVCSSFIF